MEPCGGQHFETQIEQHIVLLSYLCFQRFGHKQTLFSVNQYVWMFGHLEVWKSGNISKSGNLEILKPANLDMEKA